MKDDHFCAQETKKVRSITFWLLVSKEKLFSFNDKKIYSYNYEVKNFSLFSD